MDVIRIITLMLEDMLLSAIPAAGFAMVFNVPRRALPWCALLGAVGHGSRTVMIMMGLNIEWGTFLAAMLVGCIGIQWSRWYLAHPKVFTVAAVIPMFPGISLFGHDIRREDQPLRLYRCLDGFAGDQLP